MATALEVPDLDRVATLAFALSSSDGLRQVEGEDAMVVVERGLAARREHDVQRSLVYLYSVAGMRSAGTGSSMPIVQSVMPSSIRWAVNCDGIRQRTGSLVSSCNSAWRQAT